MERIAKISERLKQYREHKGWTLADMAEKTAYKMQTLNRYELEQRIPKIDVAVDLAEKLSINPLWLQGFNVPMEMPPEEKAPAQEKTKTAPPYTEEALKLAKDYDDLDGHGKKVVRLVADEEKARCTAPAPVEQPMTEKMIYIFPGYTSPMSAGTGQPAGDEYPENYRLVKEPPRRASFIAPVSGDSMEPTYSNGDLVFVRAQEEVEVGEIGVFWMDGQQWIKELGAGVLISHNPNPQYGPRPFTEDIKCQGLVLGVCNDSYFE